MTTALKPKSETSGMTAPAYALPRNRMSDASALRRVHLATFPDAIDPAHWADPATWKLNARMIALSDLIECRNESLTHYATFLVVSADHIRDRIEVRELFSKALDPVQQHDGDATGNFRIEFLGVTERWAIIRAPDGHVMKTGYASKSEAENAIITELTPRPAA